MAGLCDNNSLLAHEAGHGAFDFHRRIGRDRVFLIVIPELEFRLAALIHEIAGQIGLPVLGSTDVGDFDEIQAVYGLLGVDISQVFVHVIHSFLQKFIMKTVAATQEGWPIGPALQLFLLFCKWFVCVHGFSQWCRPFRLSVHTRMHWPRSRIWGR